MNIKAASTAKKKGGYNAINNNNISAGKASTTLIDESMRKTLAALRDSSDPQQNYLVGNGNGGNGFHQVSGSNTQNSQGHHQSFDAIVNSRPTPTDDQNLSYYQEFCRLFIANNVLQTQMKELLNEKTDLMGNLNRLEKRSEELLGKSGQLDSLQPKKKRYRRNANQIERHYRCPVGPTTCSKSYGSEGSLNQHIRLKHFEYFQEHIAATQKANGTPVPTNAKSSVQRLDDQYTDSEGISVSQDDPDAEQDDE